MPADVLDVTTKFMRDPIRILVKKEELTLEGIKQFFIDVNKEVRWAIFSSILVSYVSVKRLRTATHKWDKNATYPKQLGLF